MVTLLLCAHIAFSVYFFIRLLLVKPLLPIFPSSHQPASFLQLLLFCIAPLLPLIRYPPPAPIPLLISYALATIAALRFSCDAPFLSSTAVITLCHHLRLLLWRFDILAYVLFICSMKVLSGVLVPIVIYTLLATTAILTNILDLQSRARTEQRPTFSISHYFALLFQRAHRMPSVSAAPPNIRNDSAFSLLSFQWVTPTVSTGRMRPLEANDVMPLVGMLNCVSSGTDIFQPNWQKELDTSQIRRPSLFRALFRSFGLRLTLAGVLKLINDVCIFVSPMLLRYIILYLQNRDNGGVSSSRGYLLAFGMFTTYMCQSMVFNQYFNIICTVQVLLQGALVNAIYEKSTRLSPESRGLYTSGQIQNLMATDSRTVADVVLYIHMLWSSVEQIIVALLLLVQLLGWIPTAAGIFFIIACIPVQAILIATIKRLREEASGKTDERVKSVSEAIQGIKLVKLYAWELSFVRRILEARARELHFLKRLAILQAWNSVLVTSLPTILTIIAFASYAATGRTLNAAVVFPAIALFNVIRPPLLFLPNTLINSARAAASLSRLSKFLTADELVPLSESRYAVDQTYLDVNNIDIAAFNASFTWDPSVSLSNPTLSSVSFQIPEGSLVAVVGPTGSGKSTLLAGLLGELPIVEGRAGIRKNRTVSFCDQIAFIQNASVRENILFGRPFAESHYWNTIRVCALQSDFSILPAGDMTEIGGRGINLSGGQRARVSLARAVYSRSDICLMDDPLCAVDAHVGKSIFYDCIVSQLKGKTRILTTNHINFATSPEVDIIIVVKDGTIAEVGHRAKLLENPQSEIFHLLQTAGEAGSSSALATEAENSGTTILESEVNEDIANATKTGIGAQTDNTMTEEKEYPTDLESAPFREEAQKNYGSIPTGRLTKAETKKEGRVQFRHYWFYLNAMGFCRWVLPLIVFALSSQMASLGVNIWLSKWSEQQDNQRVLFNLIVLLALGVTSVAVAGGSLFALAFGSIRASIFLHEKLLLSVLGAPSSFFNATPDGRIVNRFNSDIDKVDSTLPPTLQSLLRLLLSLSFTLGLILWATPGFVFFAIPVGFVCLYIQEFYRKSSVDLRRLEALARSPLYSHFAETLDGVVTIRAYGDVARATGRSNTYTDQLNRTSYATSYANRWLAVRLEALGTILVFGATTLTIMSPPGRISASMTGLVLSYTMQILGAMTWSVRQFTECESQLSAVERIAEYSESPFPQEEAGGLEGFMKERQRISNSITRKETMGLISEERVAQLNNGVASRRRRWPRKGCINFEQVEMKYREDLEPALKGVTFSIKPGERVGIVGRTGAGKSSAIQCLFRLYELEKGRILIDGVDISTMRLFDLRSALGVIPQEPVCFSGTLRSNLDMFGEYDDKTVLKALDSCGLQETMRQKISLEFAVAENGSNLSVGQRQLLCLGRALLKDSQVLILDEATSSVSSETDITIQRTLKNEMGHCSTLTVAHRLHTVIQNDRIIVMDKGRIVEIGNPEELLNGPSRLSSLVDETGPASAAHLRYLASLPRHSETDRGGKDDLALIDYVQESDRAANEGPKSAEKHGPLRSAASFDEHKQESLRGRFQLAFMELRSALAEVESQEWKEELLTASLNEPSWRKQLNAMVSRLSALAEDTYPNDHVNGDVGRYLIEVSSRSSGNAYPSGSNHE